MRSFDQHENIESICQRSLRGDALMTTLFRGIFIKIF